MKNPTKQCSLSPWERVNPLYYNEHHHIIPSGEKHVIPSGAEGRRALSWFGSAATDHVMADTYVTLSTVEG
ncbi:MAG: hypothetical protein UY87_C0004G0010 [Candidatus Peribacteria bacterium GW2011_GWC2_54_8]|nr:MAG: hypothetical protein UY87_C0004G0010 [Candidatus Peribacteria bacterium GW2011_GWC2_54_8]KKW44327.1 MAG: hypothetical protein UY90_C0013G0018 [Candidatus Peregrinibacteria bacterium GW2011_GWA2_54_9]